MITLVAVASLLVGATANGPIADELALGQILVSAGGVAHMPVRVRDLAGTRLNEGDGPDDEIQSFALQVRFAPTFVDASSFVHAGVTLGRTAFFSQVTPGPDNIYVLKSFNENTDPLAFGLNAPLPGDLIGELLITIDPLAPAGTLIPLELQSLNAALVNASATASETVGNGQLLLRHGAIVVGPDPLFTNGFE